MCHPSCDIPSPSGTDQRRQFGSVRVAAREQQQPSKVAAGGGVTKKCVCSTSTHPGSFRCKYHRSEYKWVSRATRSSSFTISR
ncbi:hypothetical protein Pint_29845 [Pistacia integerrima]|uniref:Uncharacterized protein n=1 Tax=Pistacia integerrima TaxID=434235 RepID=A0ACC0X2J5_9ROSI|nr:hypothetical protein Pint_29845 [Pistacia integerrima]